MGVVGWDPYGSSPTALRREGYAMLMSPNKDETAAHACHCTGDIAVRMREILARP